MENENLFFMIAGIIIGFFVGVLAMGAVAANSYNKGQEDAWDEILEMDEKENDNEASNTGNS